MADKRIDQLVAATTLGNNDLLVLEQNNQAKKMSGATLASFVYNAATDKIAEVNQAVADAQDAVDSLEEQKNTIAEAIASMADLGTDTTLSTTGMAADAKAAGDRINDAETAALAGLDQAEITGVPIASFDDGADDVPVKALKIAVELKQDLHGYANPWPAGGGKNLEPLTLNGDATSITDKGITMSINSDGSYKFAGTATQDGGRLALRSKEFILAAGTYISSRQTGSSGNYPTWLLHKSSDDSIIKNALGAFTLSEETSVYVGFNVTNGTTYNVNYYPQIESGSTATSWVPYENICPITGWTGANVTAAGTNLCGGEKLATNIKTAIPSASIDPTVKTVTFAASATFGSVFIEGCFKPNTAYTLVLYGRNTTTAATKPTNFLVRYTDGTSYYDSGLDFPSSGTDNYCVFATNGSKTVKNIGGVFKNASTILYYEKCGIFEGVLTADDFEPYLGNTYDITFPLSAGTVYGGTLDVTNGVLTVDRAIIDLGDLTWTIQNNTTSLFGTTGLTDMKRAPNNFTVAPNYACEMYKIDTYYNVNLQQTMVLGVSASQNQINIYNPNYTSEAAFTTAMNGVHLVYPLATPITYTLTPPVVRTLLATNNIWADTGNILDLIYRRQPISDADIQENIDAIRDAIADREDSGVASKNYAGGSLILIGDTLYETNGPITTGESLVPGSNCTATTVAAQIAYIKSIINGLGNLAYLSYENA